MSSAPAAFSARFARAAEAERDRLEARSASHRRRGARQMTKTTQEVKTMMKTATQEPPGTLDPDRPLLYSQRRAPCGCAGVPDGQHLPGCERHRGAEAPRCRRCGYRAATEKGRCAICGVPREMPPAPAPPMLLSDAELEHPFGPGIEAPERLHWLRTATHGELRLDLWDTGERPAEGQAELAYRLCVAEGSRWVLVFAGEGFGAPAGHALDSDATLAAILGFLSLRPGEADPARFDRYTARQLAFAEERAAELALWAAALEGDGEAPSGS